MQYIHLLNVIYCVYIVKNHKTTIPIYQIIRLSIVLCVGTFSHIYFVFVSLFFISVYVLYFFYSHYKLLSLIWLIQIAEVWEGGRRESREEVPHRSSASKPHGREKPKQCSQDTRIAHSDVGFSQFGARYGTALLQPPCRHSALSSIQNKRNAQCAVCRRANHSNVPEHPYVLSGLRSLWAEWCGGYKETPAGF